MAQEAAWDCALLADECSSRVWGQVATTPDNPDTPELISGLRRREEGTRQEQSCRQGCSVSGGVANLTVTAVGAGTTLPMYLSNSLGSKLAM